jgi:predicted transcriptional regulator
MVLPALAEIKMRREALGLTQKELAKKVTDNGTHVSRVLINMIENKDHYPNYKIVEVIFMVLDLMEISQRSEGKKKKTTAGEICNGHGKWKLKKITSKQKLSDAQKMMGTDGQITQLPVIDALTKECTGLITQLSMVGKPLTTMVEEAMVGKPPTIDENMEITPGLIELLVPPQSCILVSKHNERELKGVIVAWDLLHKKESMKQLRHQQEQKRV